MPTLSVTISPAHLAILAAEAKARGMTLAAVAAERMRVACSTGGAPRSAEPEAAIPWEDIPMSRALHDDGGF